jgi:hypothetical protein
MVEAAPVTVELFGVPRLWAGRAELQVPAGTAEDVLSAVEQACPRLAGLVSGGRLNAHYLLSINGRAFVSNLAQRVGPGERLLLLSADAGG